MSHIKWLSCNSIFVHGHSFQYMSLVSWEETGENLRVWNDGITWTASFSENNIFAVDYVAVNEHEHYPAFLFFRYCFIFVCYPIYVEERPSIYWNIIQLMTFLILSP